MLEPVVRPLKSKAVVHSKNGTADPKDWSRWKKLRRGSYQYFYILDIPKLQELVSDYFAKNQIIKLIDVHELVSATNCILVQSVKTSTSRRVTEIASTSKATKENKDLEGSTSSSDENSTPSDASCSSSSESRSYLDDLNELAIKCKHYPMRLDEPTLTSAQKLAVATGVNKILESRIDLDPFLRKLIEMDAGHFAFNLLFPKRRRREEWCLYSSDG